MKPVSMQRLRRELEGNRRLQVGAVLIGVLLALYVLSGVDQWRQGIMNRLAAAQAQRVRTQALAGQTRWTERAQQAQALERALAARIPDSDSVGLAQATQQAWLRRAVLPFAPTAVIRMDPPVPVEGQPGYWRIPAEVSGPLPVARTLQLLQRIESNRDRMQVESIRISNAANPQLQMTVVALVRIVPRGGRGDG
ncbi:MAG: hypothetical protein KGI40_11620 [Xanthomonadaceae bacterium]|nr:hypothetical protein [Xanthomonadaceae bacterium]MDE2178509.1 hypothetical protein [Xanthomonadaceae bacterium]MDE2244776.1 hypothetical protein [Xanthomonadaceae bacterium]